MRVFIILISIFVCTTHELRAQSVQKADSLFLRLQKHTDSTIIIEHQSNWLQSKKYYIISKKSDTLNVFTYRDVTAFDSRTGIISGIKQEMRGKDRHKILRLAPDINEFFHFYSMRKDTVKRFWNRLMSLKPSSLKDDSVFGKGCPPIPPKIDENGNKVIIDRNVYDGGSFLIFLITKDKIKTLHYYAPDYYYERCPEIKYRLSALQIANIFAEYIL